MRDKRGREGRLRENKVEPRVVKRRGGLAPSGEQERGEQKTERGERSKLEGPTDLPFEGRSEKEKLEEGREERKWATEGGMG